MLLVGAAAKRTLAVQGAKTGRSSLDNFGGARYQVLILQISYIRTV